MKKWSCLLLALVLSCLAFSGCAPEINSGAEDVLHNGTVYERAEFPNFNILLLEDNSTYIGDFLETYDYGQQLPWEVYTLNGEENVLYSAHAVWIKPGYVFPDEYGEPFSKVEYVISEGLLDTYKEEVTPLRSFDTEVKLEDVIEATPAEITEFTSYGEIRFYYKNHADMAVVYTLCSCNGEYYLNVLKGLEGLDALHKIKPEYTELLISGLAGE